MHAKVINISAALLIVVGLGGYLLSNMVSPTALIPSVIGILLLIAEAFGARKSGLLSTLWVPLLALLGMGGTFRAVPELFSTLIAGTSAPSLPTVGRSLTAIFCLAVLIAAVTRWRSGRRNAPLA